MNAEYLRDIMNSLEKQGVKLDKVRIRVMVKGNGEYEATRFYDTSGTTFVNVDKESIGTITIEAVQD